MVDMWTGRMLATKMLPTIGNELFTTSSVSLSTTMAGKVFPGYFF